MAWGRPCADPTLFTSDSQSKPTGVCHPAIVHSVTISEQTCGCFAAVNDEIQLFILISLKFHHIIRRMTATTKIWSKGSKGDFLLWPRAWAYDTSRPLNARTYQLALGPSFREVGKSTPSQFANATFTKSTFCLTMRYFRGLDHSAPTMKPHSRQRSPKTM